MLRAARSLGFPLISVAFALLVASVGACRRKATTPAVTAAVSASSSVAVSPNDPRARAGATLFAKYCALCHGVDARGYAADHAPSLVSETFLQTATDDFIGKSIRLGRPGTPMAAYDQRLGGPLDDEAIAALVAFIRSHGPAAVTLPITPARGDAARASALWTDQCQACHGTRAARGDAPHLANTTFLSLASDEFLRAAILAGRPGTRMMEFGSVLSAQQVDDIVALLRSWAAAPVLAPTPSPTPTAPPPVPSNLPPIVYPSGPTPTFTLREGRFVPAAEVEAALTRKSRMVIIDARATSDWFNAHLPGALPIPYYDMKGLERVPKDGTWVIAYCACPHHASGVVVDELRKRGYPHTAVLDEGIGFWRNKGYPVDVEKGGVAPVVPSVQPVMPH